MSLLVKSSAGDTGVGNFPAVVQSVIEERSTKLLKGRTLGKTRTKETRNLLDECLRGQEGVVLLRKLLDQFLVLVQSVTNTQ